VNLTLPYPPSANRYWRVFRGRVVKSDQARAYQRDAAMVFRSSHPATGPVMVTMNVYRPAKRGDLDNSIKVLLDALKGVAFIDDKQVKRIVAAQFDDKARPRWDEVRAQGRVG
jgi:crossover junction endodeoxyribonuclease RusA